MTDQNQIITGSQVRMARAHIKWSAEALAKEAGVALSTIKRIEAENGISNTRVNNILAVKETLEQNGITFPNDSCVCVGSSPMAYTYIKDVS